MSWVESAERAVCVRVRGKCLGMYREKLGKWKEEQEKYPTSSQLFLSLMLNDENKSLLLMPNSRSVFLIVFRFSSFEYIYPASFFN